MSNVSNGQLKNHNIKASNVVQEFSFFLSLFIYDSQDTQQRYRR